MISVGVVEEPLEVKKKGRERLVNPIIPLPLEIAARPSLKPVHRQTLYSLFTRSKERIEGLPVNRLF